MATKRHTRRIGRTGLAGGILALAALTIAGGGPPGGGAGGDTQDILGRILDKPIYAHAQWGVLEEDPEGRVLHELQSDKFFIPGSVAKLFTVSGTWNALGGDHRFTTPVHTVGTRDGAGLHGDLVLVAQGDLALGGRVTPEGTLDFTSIDHTYANDLPGATLTPEDPLAGIDAVARQIRQSGISRVDGDVVVDTRLFETPALDPTPTPLIINDNLIDLLTTPTSPGHPAELSWRPQVAPYKVTSQVTTVAAGGTTDIEVTASDDGTQITLSGTIAADAAPALRVSPVVDPAAFGRTALIEALARAGVTVTADPVGANDEDGLPAAYAPGSEVAAYVSPPFSQYARLVLKVSHNLGANLDVCLMAVSAGSTDCDAGFPVLRAFLEAAGVDSTQVQLADGRGGDPVDRATPVAVNQLLRYWLHTPEFEEFRDSLPILGVDGTLDGFCTGCAGVGKVFAKTGTVAGFDALNEQFAVGAETVAGYLVTPSGEVRTFFVGVNNTAVPDLDAFVSQIVEDVAEASSLLQQHGG
ncbi:D-alanyl-D-alanine carboxypeptidase/D-alanyl-D-alanine-endopeptidase [Kitasatospora sp. NPDC051914]|uniref:D-alanyl-D-alanine carboxypeptidase/D-alanyl-D-alanine endopeptidase n=1 Tax=Kitasatospora sp. NPDC051914 TaxID=3154945 RepID=UPI003440210D